MKKETRHNDNTYINMENKSVAITLPEVLPSKLYLEELTQVFSQAIETNLIISSRAE